MLRFDGAAAAVKQNLGGYDDMYELSLFTGAGGGLLGTHLLGWTPVGYVEFDDYCQRIIAQRIEDGILPRAPIFGDVRTFASEGYAASYTGLVDVITAGFPCQPFSTAGKRAGVDDSRNMWPATLDVVRVVRPRFAFLENVPGLLSSGYFGTILGDLAESGYDARWRILSAAEMGAPHKRNRLWIVADASSGGFRESKQNIRTRELDPDRCCEDVADAEGTGLSQRANATSRQQKNQGVIGRLERSDWWQVEPDVGRMADGVASRVDRLKAIGNGQVPLCAAIAFLLLAGDYEISLDNNH